MTRHYIGILLSILILIGYGTGLAYLWNLPGNVYYSGNIILPTERDYVDFKMAFTNPIVHLEEVEILASDPPIIVKFKARVSDFNHPFPYGERNIQGWVSKGLGGQVLFAIICLCALFFASLPIASLSKWSNKFPY